MDLSEFRIMAKWTGIGLICLFGTVCIVWAMSALGKEYDIWAERKRGEAEYAHAEANRRIAILEAEAKMQSSKALAEAEIIRAQGVAKANKIIGDSLNDNEGYLRYLYIMHLSEARDKTVIYIPTEGGLPILESQRLLKR